MKKRSFKEKLKNDYLGKIFATFCGILIIAITITIILFIVNKGSKTFINHNSSLSQFLFSDNWNP